MSRICNLFSGSTGNCIYIGHAGSGILIDAGVSARRTEQALDGIGVGMSEIRAIFITHEHSDHISGVRLLASRYGLPVYATRGTLEAMEQGGCITPQTEIFELDDGGACVGNMRITRFFTPHDARQSCGYVAELSDGQKIAVATDLGHVTDEVRRAVTGCGTVVIESNHDVMMLQNGPYPYPLKQRVLSDTGHLSNGACAAELCGLVRGGTTRIILAHLSRQNNYPALAHETARASLLGEGMRENIDFILTEAPPSGGRVTVL